MTRFACKLGLVVAVLLGVVFFTTAPAQCMSIEDESSPPA